MKATEARLLAALDRPTPDVRLYLLHGPDESTAMAHAARLARALGEGVERVDLDGATLRSDPARLADEAAAMSLFGEARHIRVTAAGEEALEAVEALLAAPTAGNPAVMIAPTVKATGKLVKAALESERVLAFACYPPDARNAGSLASELARAQGVRLSPAATQRIVRAADGDRAVMAREIEKLALYLDAAPERPMEADESALEAVSADIAEGEMGEVVLAASAGDVPALLEALRRMGPDASPIPILRALVRRLAVIAELKVAIDGGEPVEQAMKRRGIFWKEQAATAATVRRWMLSDLVMAQAAARRTEREVIATGGAGRVVADAFLLRIARRRSR